MRRILAGISVLVALAALPGVADAQAKNRWRLGWKNEKPTMYTYRTANDKLTNYWYVIFEITNDSGETVPLIIDPVLYVETGKELQQDVRKVDPETIKPFVDKDKKGEPLKYGRFHSSVLYPEVEYKIIEELARLGNRSPGIVLEAIEAFKKGDETGNRFYLNPKEIRSHRFIKPGEKIMGIAIYKDVDPRAKSIELQVSGLIDIVRVDLVEETEVHMTYENHVLKIRYAFPGDSFHRELDSLTFESREWAVKRIGPVADKAILQSLVDMLTDALRREKEWKEQNKTPEEAKQLRQQVAIDELDLRIASHIVRLATGKDFGFDESKGILENEHAIWRTHEWWVTNKTKLAFNEITNRFEVKDDALPGTVKGK